MSTIYLVDLEPVSTRYTAQWKEHFPQLLRSHGIEVVVVDGPTDIPASTTPGAFLNFGGTNVYKASQVDFLGRLFCAGSIKPGDQFIFTDAWHPGIINLKYMSELLNIPVKIHALWHAGSYDPHDFLGRLIGDAPWVRHAEKSFFHAIDHNYFATQFHIDMFFKNLFGTQGPHEAFSAAKTDKVVRSGWPMEYMQGTLSSYKNLQKKNLILFPHRIAPEKQVEIFRDLAKQLPQYEFVVCQDTQLSKDEYHTLLGQSKLIFSANLQETLGISWYEGAVVNSIPMVPDRLSYSEMALLEFKYPAEWTENFDAYITHRQEICDKIVHYIDNFETYLSKISKQVAILENNFFSAENILKTIIKNDNEWRNTSSLYNRS